RPSRRGRGAAGAAGGGRERSGPGSRLRARPRPRGALALALLPLLVALVPNTATGETKFFPLPMYTTNPNEGSTYGLMPVILGVGENGRIANITAPSVSWNSSAGVTATIRYYKFLEELRAWRAVGSISTRVNRTLWFQYDDDRRTPGLLTQNVFV